MNLVTYGHYDRTYTRAFCEHHTRMLDGHYVFLSVTPISGGTCGECEMERANDEADRKAERRNAQILSGDY